MLGCRVMPLGATLQACWRHAPTTTQPDSASGSATCDTVKPDGSGSHSFTTIARMARDESCWAPACRHRVVGFEHALDCAAGTSSTATRAGSGKAPAKTDRSYTLNVCHGDTGARSKQFAPGDSHHEEVPYGVNADTGTSARGERASTRRCSDTPAGARGLALSCRARSRGMCRVRVTATVSGARQFWELGSDRRGLASR
jgi:hypothetical protein